MAGFGSVACLKSTMTSLQVFRFSSNAKSTRLVTEASYRPQICGVDRLNVNLKRFRFNCVAGVVAKVEKENEISGACLMVSLLAAVLTSCPPALSADFESLNVTNAKCSLTGVQANGYEFAYPKSWIRDRIRGIEVLAHDPEVAELNMSIFTSPAQSGTLSGSAAEVGEAIITQYQKSPTIDKVIPQTNELNIISWPAVVHALRPTIFSTIRHCRELTTGAEMSAFPCISAELLGVDMKQDGSSNRSYSIELFVEAGGKQRHFLTKLIRTDKKVLSLTVQVPEELWLSNASCMKSVIQNFKQTTIV